MDINNNKEATELGRVSIIVPAYQVGRFLTAALIDVENQTYRNWELIVVDDASPDSVQEILEVFQRRMSGNRIVFHRKTENSGASSTRNFALQFARGEFIAFLDADDRWHPDHLERKVDLLLSTQSDVVYSCVEVFDDATG